MSLVQGRTGRYLCETLKGKKGRLALLCFVQMVHGCCGVIQAMILKNGIDGALKKDAACFWSSMTAFTLLLFAQVGGPFLTRYLDEHLRSGIENTIKKRLFGCLLRGEFADVTKRHSGEWMTRLTSDTAVVADGLVSILPGLAGMSVRLVGALVTLVVLMPVVGRVIVPAGLVLLAFTCLLRRPLKRLHNQIQESDASLRVFLQEHLGSLMMVKVYLAENETEEKADRYMKEHRQARMNRNRLSNACNTGFHFMIRVLYLFGAAGCGYGILQGTVSYGTFIAVLQLIGQLQVPLAGMTGYGPKFYAMLSSAERLMEAEAFRQEEGTEDDKEKEAGYTKQSFREIRVNEISFAYPEMKEEVLNRLTVTLKCGEFVAMMGDSGCGKSTLMKLLLGLYPVTEGEITFVTEEVQEPVSEKHREYFAYVPQGHHLMKGSIREIISLGRKEKDLSGEEIERALKTACAEFVWELPDGVDTIIGEDGAGLSEGQLQRLSVARAIASDREILLFDEATSALDEATEKRMLLNLREQKDRTILIITHRPAALEICDRVILLECPGENEKRENK